MYLFKGENLKNNLQKIYLFKSENLKRNFQKMYPFKGENLKNNLQKMYLFNGENLKNNLQNMYLFKGSRSCSRCGIINKSLLCTQIINRKMLLELRENYPYNLSTVNCRNVLKELMLVDRPFKLRYSSYECMRKTYLLK